MGIVGMAADGKSILFNGSFVLCMPNAPKDPVEVNVWYSGAIHTIKGKLSVLGYTITSDPKNPLVFKVVEGEGYVYQQGHGNIVTPSGRHVSL